MGGNKFRKYVKMLPVKWETALAQGISFLATELDANSIEFVKAPNGVAIQIKCDEEAQREAAVFWNDYVQPTLDGDAK